MQTTISFLPTFAPSGVPSLLAAAQPIIKIPYPDLCWGSSGAENCLPRSSLFGNVEVFFPRHDRFSKFFYRPM